MWAHFPSPRSAFLKLSLEYSAFSTLSAPQISGGHANRCSGYFSFLSRETTGFSRKRQIGRVRFPACRLGLLTVNSMTHRSVMRRVSFTPDPDECAALGEREWNLHMYRVCWMNFNSRLGRKNKKRQKIICQRAASSLPSELANRKKENKAVVCCLFLERGPALQLPAATLNLTRCLKKTPKHVIKNTSVFQIVFCVGKS